MEPSSSEIEAELAALVRTYRTRCLWFLRPDYVPSGIDEQLRVLDYLERYGDLDAFRRAAALRTWLSRTSSARSAS